MAMEQHLETLKRRHADLDMRIDAERARPHPDEEVLGILKKKKLTLKDDINRLSGVREAA